MKTSHINGHSAISSLLILTTCALSSTQSVASEQRLEKCYGIVKAGMNDCQTTKTECAGSSTKDNQPDAFLFMPSGLCEKIVGGHLLSQQEKSTP